MDTDQIVQIAIIGGLMAVILVPMFKSLMDYLIKRPRRIKIEAQDILQGIYKRRLKVAKSQLPRDLRRITFLGDDDCYGASFRRVRGYIPDSRMTEFFIKLRWYQIFPAWILVPSRFLSNLVGGEVFIDARGLRNLGMFYGVVNNKRHAKEEERVRGEEHTYMDSILRHEEIQHLQEERVNALIVASSPNQIREYYVDRRELSTAESEEEEAET